MQNRELGSALAEFFRDKPANEYVALHTVDDGRSRSFLATEETAASPILLPRREYEEYQRILEDVSRVYDNLTRGRISKPKTDPGIVIQTVEELMQEDQGV